MSLKGGNDRYQSKDQSIQTKIEDLFSVTNYVNGLTKYIQQCDTPITISIQGDWGSGKTSFMNMINNGINTKVKTININTWQYSQFNLGDQMPLVVLRKIVQSLGADQEKLDRLLNFAIDFISMSNVSIISEAFDVYKKLKRPNDVIETISNLKDAFEEAIDNSIIAYKEEMIKRAKKNREHVPVQFNERVVIFVDDLDRLDPAKAVELLEILKIFMECEKCVFVLAIDYDVVVKGIEKKYGGSLSESKGRSFFDKIIQLPFKVPVSKYDIKRFLASALDNINIDTDDDVIIKYDNIIYNTIGYNPRAMKRLFNSFQLLLLMQNEISESGENELILFSFLCMQIEYEKLYNFITLPSNECEVNKFFLDNIEARYSRDQNNTSIGETEKGENIYKFLENNNFIDETDSKQKLLKFLNVFTDIIAPIIGKSETRDFSKFHNILRLSTSTQVSMNVEEPQETKVWKGTVNLDDDLSLVTKGTSSWTGVNLRRFKYKHNEYQSVENFSDALVKILEVLYNEDSIKFRKMHSKKINGEYKTNKDGNQVKYGIFSGRAPGGGFKSQKIINGTDIKFDTYSSSIKKVDDLIEIINLLGEEPSELKFEVEIKYK